MFECTRFHDFSAGHRVHGHEGACRYLHGHNYRIHFTCRAMQGLDKVGRVVDFSIIKAALCMWLELHWDHKMLLWDHDEPMHMLSTSGESEAFNESVVWVPFNPTAENMAQYLVEVVGPKVLIGQDVLLVKVQVDETRKCSATYSLPEVMVNYHHLSQPRSAYDVKT